MLASSYCTLTQAAWLDQLDRSMVGDRHYHDHGRPIENVTGLAMLSLVIARTVDVGDLPLLVFNAPGVAICSSTCRGVGSADITLSDG